MKRPKILLLTCDPATLSLAEIAAIKEHHGDNLVIILDDANNHPGPRPPTPINLISTGKWDVKAELDYRTNPIDAIIKHRNKKNIKSHKK